MVSTGGRLIGGDLSKLREAISNYYGALSEIREGHKVPLPDKPEALYLYEQCKEMKMPLVTGALRDQPHIWMMEWRVCDNEVSLWETLAAAQEQAQE